ncbi:MAG: hypothetical protein NUV77_25700, partial [Thermoguttaceae bacterium]|nr:hypothetical protein [Thermoguttaceae bacterium]
TSAAQFGEYREKSLGALKGLLQSLGPNDRVHLLAADLNTVALTKGPVAPNSPDMAAALDKLQQREPAGSTDLEKALTTALGAFADEAGVGKAIVYLGDGTSRANLLGPQKQDQLTSALVAKRVPVIAYAVGANIDQQVLGYLAAATGGVVCDAEKTAGEAAGKALASAARTPVYWPKSATWPAAFTEVLPKRLPPLRPDRDAVLIGTYKGQGPFDVKLTVEGPSGEQSLAWKIAAAEVRDENSYLPRIVSAARPTGGVGLPLSDWESLRNAALEVSASAAELTRLASQALGTNDFVNAARLAQAALGQDPMNDEARAIAAAAAAKRPIAHPTAGAAPASPAAPAAPTDDLNLAGPAVPPEGALVQAVERERAVIRQAITADVEHAIAQARSAVMADPDAAIQSLKLLQDRVRTVPDLGPDVRSQLDSQLQAALREMSRRREEVLAARQRALELQAAAKEREMLRQNLEMRQVKVNQMMERFVSLMDEGKYRTAEEVAIEAQKTIPDTSEPLSAILSSRTVGYLNDALALRVARQRGVVDTLYQVERSHVPFPDEPPIVYPDAEIWRQLSAKRKKEYASMSLSKPGKAEQRINEALSEPTKIDFTDTPLSDVIAYLEEYHKINIEFDNKALEDAGVGTDTAITRNLQGVSLRSALRLMLRDLNLTYVIQNEVLLITTPEDAGTRLSTRVYPVADLVLPIQSMGGMGGFGGMGMGMGMGMGGMGMGMGGMGMGGMMGGGFGGGMMGGGFGGGGGFFNVPGNLLPNNFAPQRGVNNGFRAFAVADDLNLTPEGEPRQTGAAASANRPASQATEAPRAANPPRRIRIEVSKNPAAAWDKYFAANKPAPADVRETVRSLWREKNYDEVIAVIQAALRHGQAQPAWMYEALSLAMQAANRPPEEIERVVMSAIDFAQSPDEMLFVALYLDQLGLKQRALQVFRQVSQIQPMRPEPYIQGLRLAEELKDLEGLQWATVGIL